MGREVKRVPMDFNWPLEKVWYGYYFDIGCYEHYESVTCEDCKHYAKIKNIPCGDKDYSCPEWPKIDKEPPAGDGYQMWETTTEGSPMSPVFDTPEKLAKWLTENNSSSFGLETATYDQWLNMIKREWAPSAIIQNGKIQSGVAAIGSID